jgi:hypothetical protein
MNEQVGFPYARRERKIPPQQPIKQLPANRHKAGHYSGIHPEDQPYSSQEFASDETEYDDMVPVRAATSVRRYTDNRPTQPSVRPRKIVVHNEPPPERYTTRTPKSVEPEERQAPRKRRWRIHWLVFVGAALLLMVLGGIGLNAASSWWTIQLDDWHYGRPRTYQTDAVVGHHDSQISPTHFIAMNLHGHVEIIEIQGGDPAHTIIYVGPDLLGPGSDLAPVTLNFVDVKRDGKPEMQVLVLGETITFLNDGTKFVAPKQS